MSEFKDVEGHFLYNLGHGRMILRLSPTIFPRKQNRSVGVIVYLQILYDQRLVMQNVYELCEEICIKLRKLKKKGKTVGILFGRQ